jgi:asparagine synthase (glutamine-hydrolysing)
MSVQFGRWNFDGRELGREYIEKTSATLAPYGPDSNERYANGGVTMLYRAFHTTKESHREVQPHVTASGMVITWDGRLDNRSELIGELRGLLKASAATAQLTAANSSTHEFTDVQIIAGAYELWGTKCLRRLIGDWALAIWNPRERSVLLANDPTGTKHLYYSMEKDHVAWCTILDPLVLFAGRTFAISEEYVAGWFSHFPAPHVTPYVGIDAVPPSSLVVLQLGKQGIKRIVSKYWDFDPGARIRYRTDADYEEHFRHAFAQAVSRRLRSDRPVLAELSGGMDSSCIVSMADAIIARGQDCPRLDTISWFDSSNLDWDDPVYFAIVENRRGRIGHHIDLCSCFEKDNFSVPSLTSEFCDNRFAATVASRKLIEQFNQYGAYIMSQGHRVTLSGIGGEQPTGGCRPTPTPELQDLLVRARFLSLARQLKAWAAKMRKPPLPLLAEALRGFLPLAITGPPEYVRPVAPWFHPGFVVRNLAAFRAYSSKVKLFGPLPNVQEHLGMVESERRLLAFWPLRPDLLREVRFPYHDRDLREFAFAIPREQLVGVGKRRFLIRRALLGIVPDELLNRKPKNFFPKSKKKRSAGWPSLVDAGTLVAGSIGIIDPRRFSEALQRAQRNEEVHLENLIRTVLLESWLRHLSNRGILRSSLTTKGHEDHSVLAALEFQARTESERLAG